MFFTNIMFQNPLVAPRQITRVGMAQGKKKCCVSLAYTMPNVELHLKNAVSRAN